MLNVMNTNMPSEPAHNKFKMIVIGLVSVVAIIAAVLIFQFFSSMFSFPLEGKWLFGDYNGSYSTIHTCAFTGDGAFQETDGNISTMGTYNVLERGSKGKVQITANSGVTEYAYAVNGDLATLTNITGPDGHGTNLQLKKDQ